MLRLTHSAVGITRGATLLFSHHETDGPMWQGEGPRSVRHPVRFSNAFLGPPVIHVSVAMWDIAGGSNQRADISADKVTADGFEIVFRTWGDTSVARIRAEWLAIGPVAHEDDFSV